MQHSEYLAIKHFAMLNGLRCLCILAVIWHHTPGHTIDWPIARLGFLGVDMFFVLSGFLIVTLLLREKSRSGSMSLKNFYMRRALRIFPIYYLLIFVITAAYFIFKPGSEEAQHLSSELPFFLTYTANWIHIDSPNFDILWSLSVEEQFYLLWPALEKSLPPKLLAMVLSAALAFNQLVNFGVLDNALQSLLGTTQLSVLDSTFTPIILGVVLAHAFHHPASFKVVSRLFANPLSTWFALLLLLVILILSPGDLSGLPRLLIHIAMLGLLASIVLNPQSSMRYLLENPLIARMGVVSYGMYLYHMWGMHIVVKVAERMGIDNAYILFLLAIVATYVVAEISYRFIEQRLLALKTRYA